MSHVRAGPVAEDQEVACVARPDQQRGDFRETPAQCLREDDVIGPDSQVCTGQKRTRAPESGLTLIRDQGHVALRAELGGLFQERGLQRPHAAFAQDRFKDEAGEIRGLAEGAGVSLAEALAL